MIVIMVALRIKELRERGNISQLDLANRSNLSRSFIAQVETGKRSVTVRTLWHIADALGVSLAEFFTSPIFDRPIVSLKNPAPSSIIYRVMRIK